MAKKIKKAQLEELQGLVNQLQNVQSQIGGLEAQKHELLHIIANGKTKLDGLQSDLQKEYGDVSVDIKTGEIRKNESDKKD
jgi:peptidoglycan hydrolase CwlO-like protein|tara:strand:- start:11619 stop:11861 length:243 start_codon:yes stop_codon:yes gene_type:complete